MGTLVSEMLRQAIAEARANAGREFTAEAVGRDGRLATLRYRVLGIVSAGTFGLVLRVQCGGAVRALKIVYEDRRYVNREAAVLMEIDHPHIVRLYAYFRTHCSESGHFMNLCMEYAPLVFEEVLAGPRPPLGRVRRHFRQALSALAHLHARQISHRDVKPANILLDAAGVLKLCDLGNAKHLRSWQRNTPYMCSRYYRPPENLLGHEFYTPKIDVWSLALVFVQFWTGAPLFRGENSAAMLAEVLRVVKVSPAAREYLGAPLPPAPPAGVRARLAGVVPDAELLDVFERALRFDYRERASAAELLAMPFFQRPDE